MFRDPISRDPCVVGGTYNGIASAEEADVVFLLGHGLLGLLELQQRRGTIAKSYNRSELQQLGASKPNQEVKTKRGIL